MYVVTVEFDVPEQGLARFLPRLLENAQCSRDLEPGCRQFDVCQDPQVPTRIFLYECYVDRAAFEAHLRTPHFLAFEAVVGGLPAGKRVSLLERLAP